MPPNFTQSHKELIIMTKFEIVQEIYKIQNQIRALKGEEEFNLEGNPMINKMDEEACNGRKYEFEDKLKRMQEKLDRTKTEIDINKRKEEYYKTPEGLQDKERTEKLIEAKKEELTSFEHNTKTSLEKDIQAALGPHWGIQRFNKGCLTIAVINEEKSTPTQRDYYFAQEIEIRYKKKWWAPDNNIDCFEANFGSCGSFNVEGGQTVGERAMYYVGVGSFFGNETLLLHIKTIMRAFLETTEHITKEVENLGKHLNNPFVEIEQN